MLQLCFKRAQALRGLLAQRCDVLLQVINMSELLLDQEAMMGAEASLQGLCQQLTLRPQTPTRQLSQGAGVPFSLNQRLQPALGLRQGLVQNNETHPSKFEDL